MRIGELDLDPRVLDVEHAAGEAVPDEQIADHDIELEPRARLDRCAVGGQVPVARLCRLDHARARDIDRCAPSSFARVSFSCSVSPRIEAIHV